nr:hypothetical protein [Tanacetum cinerariifolium]
MSSNKRSSFMSIFSISSLLSLGLPFRLEPSTSMASTFLTGEFYGLLLTCPNHLNLPSLILPTIESTSSSALKTSLGIMSIMVLPQIHLNILNSATSTLVTWDFVIERAEVYYECMEPFKSLMCLWVRNKSIAAIWLEKVVTSLIKPAIKGFAAAPAILKSEHLKVDKTRIQAAHSKATGQIIESVHWKCFGKNVGQLVIGLDKVQLNRTLFYMLINEMVSDCYMFRSGVLNRDAGYGYG